MEPIRSPRNPKIASARRLHRARERRRVGRTLLEGPHVLAEAVAASTGVLEVFGLPDDRVAQALAEKAGARWVPVDQRVLDHLAPTETPRGPVAVVEIPPPRPPTRDLIWAEVSDPGNAGTLVRACAAFALDILFAPAAVDPWSPKTLRAGAGGHFHTTVGVGDVPDGWGRIASVVAGGVHPRRLPGLLDPARRWAILVGSEAHGLHAEEAAAAEVAVTVPMPGRAESLNAGVAGALLAYELSCWRNPESPQEGPN